MITLPGLHRLEKPGSLEREVKIFRDPEWETRERCVSVISLKTCCSLYADGGLLQGFSRGVAQKY